MKRLIKLSSLFWLLVITASAPGCIVQDRYSAAQEVCHYFPDFSRGAESTLKPECRQALERMIPYHEESFKAALPGTKDRVTEAFQALIAYPLVTPPMDSLLGTRPPLGAGVFPPGINLIFTSFPNPNQSVFNTILGNIDEIMYRDSKSDSLEGQFVVEGGKRKIIIYPKFWQFSNDADATMNPIIRASLLVHESAHSNSSHVLCTQGKPTYDCDSDLNGAYGAEVFYLMAALLGGAAYSYDGKAPPLAFSESAVIMNGLCEALDSRINIKYGELQELMDSGICREVPDYLRILKLMGLRE